MKNKTMQAGVTIKSQSGAALLISIVVLTAVFAFYLMGRFGADSAEHERQDRRVESMAAAKKALIAHAVNYIDMRNGGGIKNDGEMGFLPCPDRSAAGGFEGIQAGNCEARDANAIGRFPWRSLDAEPLHDDANECLWYAVTGYYKSNPKALMLNEDTNGMFEIYSEAGNLLYGAEPEDRIVAVIIAPGRPVQGQNRTRDAAAVNCNEGSYTASLYLEGNGDIDNAELDTATAANTVTRFIKAGTNSELDNVNPFNDLILTISRDDIWNAVKRRNNYLTLLQGLTSDIAQCLVNYGNLGTARNLPWPAATDLNGASYHEDGSYADVNAPASLLGRLPDSVVNSETALQAIQTSSFPPGPPAGVPPGPPNNVPPGGGNGNGNNGGGNNAGGNNNGGNNAGGNNSGTVLTTPPTGDPECTTCWNDYQEEITEANTEYDECIADGEPPGQCKNARKDEYDEALADYNNCIAPYTCSQGGGNGSGEKGMTEILTGCLSPESFVLWQHWKDHFYYAVSGDYSPTSTNTVCNGNCVSVDGNPQAGIVFFAGERTLGQRRNDPQAGDADFKNNITNYLERVNSANYPDANGSGIYFTTNNNDYMVCIRTTDPLTSSVCP